MRVLDFLKLTDSEKVKYKQHVYACGWGSDEYIEYDFEVFYGGWPCELCGDGKEDVKTYGASD